MKYTDQEMLEFFQDEFAKIKDSIIEELRKEFPSPLVLEIGAKKAQEMVIVNLYPAGREIFLFHKRKLEIFQADLLGKLNFEYTKKLKSYREKWIDEKITLFRYLDNILEIIKQKNLPES